MIQVLLAHPSPETATGLAAELDDAAPTVSVAVATTLDDAVDRLRASGVDCIVVAFDPVEQSGRDLLRALRDTDADVPQVLAPNATLDDAKSLADRVAAATSSSVSDLLDAVPGVGCLVRPDGEVVRANDRAAEALGAATDVTGLVPPTERAQLSEALDEAVAKGRATTQAPLDADEQLPHEWTLTRLDGVVCAIGIDVSSRVAFASELRETEASLAALYDTLSNRDISSEERLKRVLELGCDWLGVEYGFLTRINGNTQHIVASHGSHPMLQPGEQCPLSEAYCRKTMKGEGLLGVHDAIAAGWESDPAYDAFGLGCYLGGKVLADGRLYGTLCFADDDPRGTSFTDTERAFVELLTRWVSYELEEQMAREELERQNDRLSEFASIVSHDIRNPLNVAKGKLQIARETGGMDHLDEAEDALDRMEQLVTGLLDLAKQGTVIETVDDVTLSEVATDAWENVATDDTELVVDADGVIEADRERLLQLLENLFRNSVEHGSTNNRRAERADDSVEHGSTNSRTESGDSVEHGSTNNRRAERADDSVEHGSTNTDSLTVHVGVLDDGFYVADTGPGIDPDQRETIFERGHSTGGGSGLGLTIVRAVADAHGWSTAVTESDSGGARFEFSGVDRPVAAR